MAVVQDQRLGMWQVHQGGWLQRYEEGPPELSVQAVHAESFQATLDGRHLYAIGDRGLFTWEFPRYAIEQG